MSGNPLRSECHCPKCGGVSTSVKDSRGCQDGSIRRRRICDSCLGRFSTIEIPLESLRNMQAELEALDSLRGFLGRPSAKRFET